MPDSPFPDAPDDFDDSTELVKGWSGAVKAGAAATPEDFGDEPGGWDEEEATAVVGATDIGGFFGERFRVDARLGIGAMGRVLTAVDMKTGTLVALKVLHKERAKDTAVVERFQREAAVLHEMRHPAIVRLVAFDRARDGTWWLAMEHLVGKTLKDRLSQGGPYTPRDAWPIIATVCDGVATAHAQGILHRDLKPENVLLLESGLPPAKILDFGLSRYTAKPDRITATGTVLGTPRYMAPEVLAENGTIDERADVFAIGAIVFEMLTGRSIYPADDFGQLFGCILEGRVLSLRSIRPDAPPALDRLLADAVAKDLSARVPTVDTFARLFAAAVGVSPDRTVFLPAGSVPRPEPASGVRDTARDLAPLARAAAAARIAVPAPHSPAAGSPVGGAQGARPAPTPATPVARALAVGPATPAPVPRPPPPARGPAAPPPEATRGAATPPGSTHAAAVHAAPPPVAALAQPVYPPAPSPPAPSPVTGAAAPMGATGPSYAAPLAAGQLSPPHAFAPPPGLGAGGSGTTGRHPGVAPHASFTRPNTAPPAPQPRAVPPARDTRSMALWLALFLVAAVVTMTVAGALAYAVRVWLLSS